ncbi:GNAT family N-acetyltransferase [uncultured Microbulbifer sp.]|uniref:GNAT family N-acetyltransferase n=1 Tax=uncultured Microbulbifer sp. TaxID=348147 RepID=UPI0025DFA201|nr:GNAT family N-acetyltransferase [uncultured Microbulbifer sp.]
MEILNLAHKPEMIDILASWHYLEWGSLYPDESLQDFKSELGKCIGPESVPATFVAVENGEPVGSISVLARDMDIDEPWGPWLANFYVKPECRGTGIGNKLIETLLGYCVSRSIPHLYLFTPSTRKYYERLGWDLVRTVDYHGQVVDIMLRALPAESSPA